jgi:hypothetical protein
MAKMNKNQIKRAKKNIVTRHHAEYELINATYSIPFGTKKNDHARLAFRADELAALAELEEKLQHVTELLQWHDHMDDLCKMTRNELDAYLNDFSKDAAIEIRQQIETYMSNWGRSFPSGDLTRDEIMAATPATVDDRDMEESDPTA